MRKLPQPPPVEALEPLIKAWERANKTNHSDNDCTDDSSEDEERDWPRDDPYEVLDEQYRRVTHIEYTRSLVEAFDRDSIKLGVDEFVKVSQQSALHNANNQNDQEFDPLMLVRAVAIGCNIERWAHLTASCVPYGELQMLENYDTTRVLNFVQQNPQAKRKVEAMTSELLFSLMTVDLVTQHPPTELAKKLEPPPPISSDSSSSSSKTTNAICTK